MKPKRGLIISGVVLITVGIVYLAILGYKKSTESEIEGLQTYFEQGYDFKTATEDINKDWKSINDAYFSIAKPLNRYNQSYPYPVYQVDEAEKVVYILSPAELLQRAIDQNYSIYIEGTLQNQGSISGEIASGYGWEIDNDTNSIYLYDRQEQPRRDVHIYYHDRYRWR